MSENGLICDSKTHAVCRVPTTQTPCEYSSGQRIEAVFRFGCHYPCTSKHADPAWQLDLYQRNAIVTGFILKNDLDLLPPENSLVRITATVIRAETVADVKLWVRSLETVCVLGADQCIFDLALPHWVIAKPIVDQAATLWATLPVQDRQFINSVFIEPDILRRFLSVPASCRHHHAHEGGCVEHSVQTAEIAAAIAARSPHLDRDLLVTIALVHDVGKSLEYEQGRNGNWYMSRIGQRIGHKVSGIALATAAMARCIDMRQTRKESMLHMLSCSYGPAWAGLRSPRIPEAHVFSSIDRLSAEAGVCARTYG